MGKAGEDKRTEADERIKGATVRVKQREVGDETLALGKSWAQRAKSWYKRYILELVLREGPIPPSKDGRHVPLNPLDEKHLIDEP